MTEKKLPKANQIHTIIFDFDGVFTNNKVTIDQNGNEFITCDRGDGLAFDLLKSFLKEKAYRINYFILSKERNKIVNARASKLKIKCHHNISNKLEFIKDYLSKNFPNQINSNKGIIYLGNDINDYSSMKYSGYSVAPKDAHPSILEIADVIINKKGGEGFIRLFVEKLIKDNEVDILGLV